MDIHTQKNEIWTLHHIQSQLKLDQKPKQELKQLE